MARGADHGLRCGRPAVQAERDQLPPAGQFEQLGQPASGGAPRRPAGKQRQLAAARVGQPGRIVEHADPLHRAHVPGAGDQGQVEARLPAQQIVQSHRRIMASTQSGDKLRVASTLTGASERARVFQHANANRG
jgi:hypothetical protein